MSISRVMAEGIATHRALKLVGRVGHHIMAASGPSEHAQNGFHADVTRSQPGIAEFSFPRRLHVGDMIGPDGQ
jgi:hypothetical protein